MDLKFKKYVSEKDGEKQNLFKTIIKYYILANFDNS